MFKFIREYKKDKIRRDGLCIIEMVSEIVSELATSGDTYCDRFKNLLTASVKDIKKANWDGSYIAYEVTLMCSKTGRMYKLKAIPSWYNKSGIIVYVRDILQNYMKDEIIDLMGEKLIKDYGASINYVGENIRFIRVKRYRADRTDIEDYTFNFREEDSLEYIRNCIYNKMEEVIKHEKTKIRVL